ncbi:MAG: hypothetical protein U9N48_04665 [Euryarchaeota archaeon]|nr:hypothetical protein [Euryarchaeota archaeon]
MKLLRNEEYERILEGWRIHPDEDHRDGAIETVLFRGPAEMIGSTVLFINSGV